MAGKDVVTVSGIVHPRTVLGEAGARELDSAAKGAGRRVIGTGLFPGFLMDVLPLGILSNIVSFEEIRLERVADMTNYGTGVLSGSGIGRPPQPVIEGSLFDGGLRESFSLLCESLGVGIKEQHSTAEPIVSQVLRRTDRYTAEPGTVCVNADTWRRLAAHCRGCSLGTVSVKGKGERELFRVDAVFSLPPTMGRRRRRGDSPPWCRLTYCLLCKFKGRSSTYACPEGRTTEL